MHEEDLRWVSNIALFAGAFMLFAGVLFAEHFEDHRLYLRLVTLFVAGIFGGFGIVIRLYVNKKIKDTTIIRMGGRR